VTPSELKRRVEALEAQAQHHGPGELVVEIVNDPEAGRKGHVGYILPSSTQPTIEEYLAYQQRERERVKREGDRVTRLVIKLGGN
jgi:hypothetical protein